MYILKENPEDFIVNEISCIKIKEKGHYLIAELRKKDYTTLKAVELIAARLNLRVKDVGFAGNKDRKAITKQAISMKNYAGIEGKIESLRLDNITIAVVGYSDAPVSLGDLDGNEFTITVRGIEEKCIRAVEKLKGKKIFVPNYFGEQRFSTKNVEVGKAIVHKDYAGAARVLAASKGEAEDGVRDAIGKNKNDPIRALRSINIRLLKMFVHAYQSRLWNKTLERYLKKYKASDKDKERLIAPMIGFGMETEDKKMLKITEDIMKEEKITGRSFIIREMPEASAEGVFRDAFISLKDFEIVEKGDDFLKVNFTLKKGQYATTVIDFLFH